MKIELGSVEELILLPLVLDVLLNDLLINTHRGDEVPSRPEGFLRRVSSLL